MYWPSGESAAHRPAASKSLPLRVLSALKPTLRRVATTEKVSLGGAMAERERVHARERRRSAADCAGRRPSGGDALPGRLSTRCGARRDSRSSSGRPGSSTLPPGSKAGPSSEGSAAGPSGTDRRVHWRRAGPHCLLRSGAAEVQVRSAHRSARGRAPGRSRATTRRCRREAKRRHRDLKVLLLLVYWVS